MRRRRFLGVMARTAAAAAAFPANAARAARTDRRPNVVYVFSDEHRWQSMSFTELPQVHTPNMARLAAEGVQFTQCISNYPVCSPHRAMLMTSRWPYQQGVIDNDIRLGQEEMTIGKAFLKEGYRTGYIGKWHLGGVRAEPFGFEESLIWTRVNSHWDDAEYHPAVGDPVQPKGYGATLMTDQALDFIDRRKDGPFFLMLSLNPPHSDFLAAPEDKKALYPAEGSLPQRPNTPSTPSEIKDVKRIWDQNSWPYYQGYHAHVSAVDDELGRIMETLDSLGLAENTILIYTSDHGSMLGSHGVGGKRQPYEESIRVPFIARWPGRIPPGGHVETLFGTIDIFPTVCGLAGAGIPRSCQGRDYSPHIRGRRRPAPTSQFIMHIDKTHASGGQQHPAPLFRGIRTPRYTYAVYPDKPWCLFDNANDPLQLENLIDSPAHKTVRATLHRELQQWLKRAQDPLRRQI